MVEPETSYLLTTPDHRHIKFCDTLRYYCKQTKIQIKLHVHQPVVVLFLLVVEGAVAVALTTIELNNINSYVMQ